MEVSGTALSAIQTILSALESPHLKKILSIYGYESKLVDLQSTVMTINNVLLDAEAKQVLSNVAQHLIDELKDVVFEAEDLLDEFVTLAEQNKHLKADGTISNKMKRFLSRSNPLLVAFKMSKGVDKIRKKLDAFAYNKQFMMEFNHEPIRFRKPETYSYVDVVEIVGREGDLENIVGKLLDSDVVQSDVSFLSIVGMGGLGKTALAQLVYNDQRVETAFDLRLWHCVSDQEQKQLDIIGILGKILGLTFTNEKCTDQSSLQIVQSQLQKKLSDKKYLLVLDDVWTENHNHTNIEVKLSSSPILIKNCFSFCAIFPKDWRMSKNTLINLWMAHNYIVPLHEGQSIEDAGEEHFLILLRRCFFQDIRKDVDTGEVDSVMIHDLLHDIAQGVSRKEVLAGTSTIIIEKLYKKIRHISLFKKDTIYEISSLGNTRLHSYLDYYTYKLVDYCFVERLVKNCRYLRALKLVSLRFKCLTNSIGELLHLRYLDLSSNETLEVLPKSITKLCNLEILILSFCSNLKELPEDSSRLIKLRVLDISHCSCLKYMPKGMDKLTCLYRLSDFIVGSEDSCSSWSKWFLGLEELKSLNNLNGELGIIIKWPKNVCREVWEGKGFYLRDKKHLNHIRIDFAFNHKIDSRRVLDNEGAMKLMEYLHPSSSLHVFEMTNYVGKQMPKWISHLHSLDFLQLYSCYKLEYLECFGNVKEISFLPSLQKLILCELPKLKGWRKGGVWVEDKNNSLCLPCLKELRIGQCEELTCFPVCPRLEVLSLNSFNEGLRGIIKTERGDKESREVIVLESSKLRDVDIDDVKWLNSLPIQVLQHLETLTLRDFRYLDNFGDVEKVFRACSSLRVLKIEGCLRSIVVRGLQHLSALEILEILWCENQNFSEEQEENDGVVCSPFLLPSLLTLKLFHLPMMENLPNWIQFFPSLQTLRIENCYRLKAMPNWMPKLTSLKQLHVTWCSKSLERRCKEDPPGEDWPYIQHIPNIQFLTCFDRSPV